MKPKFRAWDNEEKWMVDGLYISFDGDVFTDDVKSHDTPHREIEITNAERYELMQSTGLKDKNGVEIYEGDVIERTFIFRGAISETFIGIVGYSERTAQYIIKSNVRDEELVNALSKMSLYEVIGNIYENSELLEGADE
ncbi:YopX family protein [Alkalibacterium sp. MB6]|uniref:YopX family protein n=1 Tax=Alkalibacterium sp. MB6 TaxID=2081965 RepID=UPI00137A8C9A|nr:YopX family protein [Alkalibacterium sp. MB6]